ncbi:ABC transporter permease [Palleronia sp.]|uniref:ABC transporter permease n=1 Tax=Palleronia sp. TaxID=1940284 RepID=UPI0035C7BA6B
MTEERLPALSVTGEGGNLTLTIDGDLVLPHATALHLALQDVAANQDARFDLSEVGRFDTSGAWLLVGAQQRFAAAGHELTIIGANDEVDSLIRAVADAMPKPEAPLPARNGIITKMDHTGRAVTASLQYGLALIAYLGLFLARLGRSLRHPREFRLISLVHHCQEVGIKAVPIVSLMAFLIGVVLAFQGSAQLRQFGAEVFVVDLIAISVLRELGILLTAIIVAGRTASAFTASIGSMKMREEIDAMRTLGLDPAMVLFVPRILALLLMLPILGLIANLMGLFGGGLMSWIELGISPAMFHTRLVEGSGAGHLMVGMIKAPVFALIIGIVGCHAGMQVQSNAESLGRMTSNAVVTAIFAVIVADALFSLFFAQIGI